MTFWIILAFIIGGTVGFVICSIMTISSVVELEAENDRLRKCAEPHETGSQNMQTDVFSDLNRTNSGEGNK